MEPIGNSQPLQQWDALNLRSPGNARERDPAEAAREFESLLIGQLVKSARESSGGWLGLEEGSGSSIADFAEQHVAAAIGRSGGLGLATMIERGLRQTEGEPALEDEAVSRHNSTAPEEPHKRIAGGR